MAIAIKVPDVGAADDSVSVVNWLVQVGDQVVRGQKIVSLETDKAVIDLESVASGAILKLCVAAGEDAVVGDVLAYVGVVGELASEPGPHRQDGNEADGRDAAAERKNLDRPGGRGDNAASPCSPPVRNLARDLGVSLEGVTGTGIGGAITRHDVLALAKGARPDAAKPREGSE